MKAATYAQVFGPGNQSADAAGPAFQPLRVVRGDTLRRVWLVRDADGAPLPMGGVVARVTVKDGAGRDVALWASDAVAPRVVLADGEVRLDATPADTAAEGFKPGAALSWDLVLSNGSGQRFVFVVGPLAVVKTPGSEWQP